MEGYYRKKLQVSLRVKEPVISYPGGEGVEGFLGGPHGLRGGTKGRSIVANRV